MNSQRGLGSSTISLGREGLANGELVSVRTKEEKGVGGDECKVDPCCVVVEVARADVLFVVV